MSDYSTDAAYEALSTGVTALTAAIDSEQSAVVRVFLGDALREMKRAKYEVDKAKRVIAEVETYQNKLALDAAGTN